VIEKLVVANRGEIARRVFRTARRIGIATVAVHEPADADAPFVREADEAVPIDSYLRGERVVEAAARAGADAVHPGYGFLAESPEFARRCVDAGLVWIGPPPEVLEVAGSKLRARELAASVGVPVLEGEALPALVKASAGGGGRGMRLVTSWDELEEAKRAAAREAEAAFGDGTLYVEPFVEGARHVEVQILGDVHGTIVQLGGRDCTVQRRWQKVIEEAPAGDERLFDAAVRVGDAIGYVNAGTVEFLVAPDGAFFFLEVNGRLQVEHPVTEAVMGIDLVEQQLRVAEGAAVRPGREGLGHAVEARIYAEGAGTLHRLRIDGDVRVETGVEDGSVITTKYDPLLAKVIAHAPTREEAIRTLQGALRRALIHGVATNRDALLEVLAHPDFRASRIDTQWFERLAPRAPRAQPLHALAAALAGQAARRAGQSLPSGWRNNPSQLQRTTFAGFAVGYDLQRGLFEVNGERVDARVVHCTPELVALEVEGVRRAYDANIVGSVVYVDGPDGSSELHELDRFPLPAEEDVAGSLSSPMPGIIVRVDVEPGQRVDAGQPLVVLDAMKMEHTVSAPHAGRVAEVRVAAGDQVEGGRALVVLE
jgi:propionyl-CoA carboxylase alpha chain